MVTDDGAVGNARRQAECKKRLLRLVDRRELLSISVERVARALAEAEAKTNIRTENVTSTCSQMPKVEVGSKS